MIIKMNAQVVINNYNNNITNHISCRPLEERKKMHNSCRSIKTAVIECEWKYMAYGITSDTSRHREL